MEKKYVNEGRYKTSYRDVSRKRVVKKQNKVKRISKKASPNRKKKMSKVAKLVICTLVIILVASIARFNSKEEDEPFIPIIFGNHDKENTGSINVAIYDNPKIGTNNSVITELEQYIYPVMLRIGKNYSLNYELITSIKKMSNKEYEIAIKEDSGITVNDIKNTIDSVMKEKNKYYDKVKNIEKIDVKSDNSIDILLKNDDEYFVYNLNIPIYKETEKYGLYRIKESTDAKLSLERKENADEKYVKYINVIKVNDEDKAIEKYKEGSIDVFFSNSSNSIKKLGKYEYDIKSYNRGEGIFLMFNKASKLLNEKYIRQVVAYSVDRESILKENGQYTASIIDLPYIYDEERYKYDIYAAENLISSNGYKKRGLYNFKNGTRIDMDLIVNKDDEEKINIANKIKNDLLKIGVNLNIIKLSADQISQRISSGDYDIVIASIYMNENPNISYIQNSLMYSDETKGIFEEIKNSDIDSMPNSISKLKAALSSDIAIYGIYSKQTYVIYKKGTELFKNINYMNLLENYFEDGRN